MKSLLLKNITIQNHHFSITNISRIYERDKHFTFKGVFLLTPDLRFRNEFENQGIHVIPYDLNVIKIRMPYAKFNANKVNANSNKKIHGYND